jgi:2-keto-3-deoxy-L-fuconate dehydrogenase
MFDLSGKTALVTGGASGIGLAISKTFAKQGAFVHILELNIDLAEQVVNEIIADGGQAAAHALDISKQADVVNIVNAIATEKPINIFVNNAGIAHIGKADTTAEIDFDRVININVKGVYNCLMATIPHLKANGGG